MERFVQLLLKNGTEFFELLDLRALEGFDISSGTGSELLFVLIPVVLKFFQVVLFLPEQLIHLNVIGIEESRPSLIVLLIFELLDLGLGFLGLY